jgi:tape measure domain-containing protein
VADWNLGGGEEEIVDVRARLVGSEEYVAKSEAVSAATEEMGVAADVAGKQMEGASRRSFLMQQAMFTLRRFVYQGTLALVAAGGASVYFGLQFDSNMQQSTVALTQFLGSSVKAKNELASLYHLAAYTPFSFQDVTTAAKSMLSFGFSVQDTNHDLTVMADTMSGLGESGQQVQQFTNDIVKMAARGKLMGQDIRELVSLHIPALAILQKQLGLTADQIQNIGEAGIPASVAIPALFRGLEQQYGGMAAKQQRTLAGRLSTLKDLTQQALGTAMMPLFTWLQNTALPVVNEIVNSLAAGFGKNGFLGSLQELNRSNAPFWFKILYTTVVRTYETLVTLYNTLKPLILIMGFGLLATLYLLNTAMGIFNRHVTIAGAVIWLLIYAYVAYNIQTWIALARGKLLLIQTAIYVTVMDAYAASLWLVVAAMYAWNVVLELVNVAMGLLDAELWLNPIGLLVLAILAAVVVFGLLYWKSKTFRDFVDNSMMPGVLTFFSLMIKLIMAAAHAMDILHGKWSFLPDAGGIGGTVLGGLVPGLGGIMGGADLLGHFTGGGSSKPHVKSHNIPDRTSRTINLGTSKDPIIIHVPVTLDRKVLGEAVAHYNDDQKARR